MAEIIINEFVEFWRRATAPDQAGRTKIMCSPHYNFPGGCFELHHPDRPELRP